MARVARTQHTVRGGWDVDKNALRAYHVQTARQELRQAQNEKVFPVDERGYVTRVDKIVGHGKEHRVRFGGRILYFRWGLEHDWIPAAIEVIRIIMRKVPRGNWPVYPGAPRWRSRGYERSFIMLRGNRLVVRAGRNFAARAIRYIERSAQDMQPGEILSVVNIQPYARRIEHGAPGQTPWSMQVPRGVLRRAESEARSRKKTRGIFLRYEVRQMPGGVAQKEVDQQGEGVAYAERRRARGGWKYSGNIVRKHRVYPVLHFGPPFQGQANPVKGQANRWSGREHFSEILSRGGILRGVVPSRAGGAGARTGTLVNIRRGR